MGAKVLEALPYEINIVLSDGGAVAVLGLPLICFSAIQRGRRCSCGQPGNKYMEKSLNSHLQCAQNLYYCGPRFFLSIWVFHVLHTVIRLGRVEDKSERLRKE